MLKKITFILFGIVLISLFFFYENKRTENINNKSIKDLDLKFSGVITEIEEVRSYNGYGIIRLKLINSNQESYDPRDSLDFYYCVVKNGIAEVYNHAYRNMKGDTINIDTKRKTISYGSLGHEHDEGDIKLNSSEGYY